MSDLLARVAAIAARETAKSSANREDMRAQHPDLAAAVDGLRAVFGEPHAITVAGTRYGKPPMPFRRDQPDQPTIPGVSGYGYDAAGNRPAIGGPTRKKPRGGGGVSRNRRPDGIAGTAEARPWWDADDERVKERD